MTVCRIHGGASPRGVDHPRFKHGRYSRYLPERLQERYQTAQSDPNLLAMREDIALLDARVGEKLSQIDTGESGEAWRAARELFKQLKGGIRDENEIIVDTAIEEMEELFERAKDNEHAWHEVQALLDQRRKTSESETKRLVSLQQMITVERAMVMISTIVSIIQRHVTDKAILTNISAELGTLTSLGSGQEALTAGKGKRNKALG